MSTQKIKTLCDIAEILLQIRDETTAQNVVANDMTHYQDCNSYLNTAWENTLMAIKSYTLASTPSFPRTHAQNGNPWEL